MDTRRIRSALVALLCLVIAASVAMTPKSARARAPDAREVREGFAAAKVCERRLEYRCVTETLGPLLMDSARLPEALSLEEAEALYETLALNYLWQDREVEAKQTFTRLLRLRPHYRLRRLDVPPEFTEFVARLADELPTQESAREVGGLIVAHSKQNAMQRAAVFAAEHFLARTGGQTQGLRVLMRAQRMIKSLREQRGPGALRGPSFHLTAAHRLLVGDDAQAWGDGLGFMATVGLIIEPILVRFGVGWTHHASMLTNTLLDPTPDLDIIALELSVGHQLKLTSTLLLEISLGVGVEMLHVGGRLESVDPSLSSSVGLLWRSDGGFGLELRPTAIGLVGRRDSGVSSVSFALLTLLGLSYSL